MWTLVSSKPPIPPGLINIGGSKYSRASKYAAPITADFADTRFLIVSKKTRKTLKIRALRGTASKFDDGFSTSGDSTELNIDFWKKLFNNFTIRISLILYYYNIHYLIKLILSSAEPPEVEKTVGDILHFCYFLGKKWHRYFYFRSLYRA